MKVVMMRLITGEELIARKNDDGLYEKVCVFNIQPDGEGKMKAGMFPFLAMVPDATIPLNAALILTEYEAPADIAKGYLQSTTGIQLV